MWGRDPFRRLEVGGGAWHSPFGTEGLTVVANGLGFPIFQIVFKDSLAGGTEVGGKEGFKFNFMLRMNGGLHALD